jgi:hypothetical protein
MNLISQLDLPGGVSEGRAWSSEDAQPCSFKVLFAFSRPFIVNVRFQSNHR